MTTPIRFQRAILFFRRGASNLTTYLIRLPLFVWVLEKNGLLYRADGTKRIADNALVALTLIIAESKPDEKNTMTQVVVNRNTRKTASMR
jgi:hypothetical protein